MNKTKNQIITFIGTTNYRETQYRFFNGKAIEERFGGIALTEHLTNNLETTKDIRVLFICTQESHNMHASTLVEKMRKLTLNESQYEFLIFSENNLKKLFADLFQLLKTREIEKLYLDITNTFRDIPFLLYPELLFFRETFNIEMEVLYARGNLTDGFSFERTNASTEIINWLFATKMFINNGDGNEFAKMLQKRYQKLKANATTTQEFKIINHINKMSKYMTEFSIFFNSVDIFSSGKAAWTLTELIKNFDRENVYDLFDFPWVIKTMLNQISSYLEKIKINYKTKSEIILNDQEIKREQNILQWYIEIEDYKSAIVLFRELIINFYCYGNQIKDFLLEETRETISRTINSKLNDHKNGTTEEINEIEKIWEELRPVRNFISHCGSKHDNFPNQYPQNVLNSLKKLSTYHTEEIKKIVN